MSWQKPRVLCVDDEPNVLSGLKLSLRRHFDVETATSGAAGLATLKNEGPFAVVLSDLEGLPYADIAELMEVPVGTVKSRLFRGRRQLQTILYDYAVEMGYIAARAGTDE